MNPSTCKMILFLSLSVMNSYLSSAADTLIQGDSLNISSSLVSRNGLFTLGFGRGYLAINYTKDEINHPIWLANRDNLISENTASLTIDEFGSLKIMHGEENPFVIYSGNQSVSTGKNVTAILQNDGNLVLKLVKVNSTEILWESFDYPVDTFVPGMKIGFNKKNGKKWILTSWIGADVPTTGAFTAEWDPQESQVIVRRRNGVRYWTTGALKSFPFIDPMDHNYMFRSVSNSDEEYVLYTLYNDNSTNDSENPRINISRWFLDYNGNVVNGQRRPLFLSSEFCDGNSTDMGCERWDGPECRRDGDKFVLKRGNFWPQNYGGNSSTSLSFIDCKQICWENCSCTGFQNSGGTGCLFYYGDFNDNDLKGGEISFYVIIPGPSAPSESKTWIWIIATLAIILIFVLMGMFWYLRWRKLKQEEKFLQELLTSDGPNDAIELQNNGNRGQILKLYSVASMVAATNSFSWENKLGEGGFGSVYKGKLANGDEIAVKRLSRRSTQGLIEFKNELLLIAKLQHTNLVRLLGFCIQGEERMLVYEYMPNKSLDSFIFDESKKELLDWDKRFNIIEGIAQGLLYLHKYSRLRIIHRDLKASNILLDKDMNPKISDFGMARIFMANENEANTNRIVGTYGYMSPEYAMNGIFSAKSDVYSFGVLILEIVSGKRNHSIYNCDRMLNLVGYAWELWKGDVLEIIDPTLCDLAAKDQIFRCINVGLLCLEQNPSDRPTMSDVLSMLTSDVKELPVPKQPAYYVGESIPSTSGTQDDCSANTMSLTQIYGR